MSAAPARIRAIAEEDTIAERKLKAEPKMTLASMAPINAKTKNWAAFCAFKGLSVKDPPGATQGIRTEVHHPDGADPDWTPGLKSFRSPGLFQNYSKTLLRGVMLSTFGLSDGPVGGAAFQQIHVFEIVSF